MTATEVFITRLIELGYDRVSHDGDEYAAPWVEFVKDKISIQFTPDFILIVNDRDTKFRRNIQVTNIAKAIEALEYFG